MKKKFLLLLLLSLLVISYTSFGFTKPISHQSYLEKLVSKYFSNSKTNKVVIKYPKGAICRSYAAAVPMTTPVLWSNVSSWTALGLQKPIAGGTVVIPAGVQMILNETPPNLASITINGKLEFANANLNLTAGWIMVNSTGTLQIGTVAQPFTNKAIITLNSINMTQDLMGMGTRGIMVMGGKLELHGTPPIKHVIKLNDHAAAGANNLSLSQAVNWSVNDEIVIATTDFYNAGNGSAQRTKITNINATNLNIENGLNAYRWGKLQYLTATGMSLTQGTLPANILAGTPNVLDERAEIASLTRNIVIQSVDDALWQNNAFGCHIMIMRSNGIQGEARLNGVEIKRGGQAGIKGRYPFHWHMLSYSGNQTLPDVSNQYIKNSTVNQSAQRGIVIHGTNGALVQNNVVYDVKGHGIFTEDASERRNTIDGNIVLKVRNPLNANVLKQHESENNTVGSSGYWVSNPDNTIINNIAVDCIGSGFWLAFPRRTFGESVQIILNPNYMKFGIFNNNTVHSSFKTGIFIDQAEIDEEGNTSDSPQYVSTSNMVEPGWPYEFALTYELGDYSTWKNNRSGIWNRSALVRNRRAVSADNTDRFFSGTSNSDMPGAVDRSLVVGTSLNYNKNGVTVPTEYGTGPLSAFASYHSTFDLTNNVVVNFPADPGKPSGYMALNDYYLVPVDKGNVRNTGNILVNSHPGVRTMPGQPGTAFGVLWDFHDYFGGPASEDNWYVYNTPFFTHGQTNRIVNPSSAISGGIVTVGPFYGFQNFVVNKEGIDWNPLMEINVTRRNASLQPVGNWFINEGIYGGMLQIFRHFATNPAGIYDLDFPTLPYTSDAIQPAFTSAKLPVNDVTFSISNMLSANDYQVIAIEYSGTYLINALFTSTAHDYKNFNSSNLPISNSNTRVYSQVANLAAVTSAATGEVYWQDRINNKVWCKIRGGLKAIDTGFPLNHDINLYRDFNFRVYGTLNTLSTNSNIVSDNNDLKVYPNPVGSSEISLSWNNTLNTNDSVKIFNAIGQMIYQKGATQKAGENLLKVDASNWAGGIYFVQVGRAVVKLVKN